MSVFLRLLAALEVFLFLKKLREQQHESLKAQTTNFSTNQNPLHQRNQGPDSHDVEAGQK